MNEVPHPGFDKPEEYETFTTTNGLEDAANKFANQDCVTFISRKNGFIAGANWQKEQPDFPTTDEQVKEFLATHPKIEVPEKYKNPDWLFEKQEQPEQPTMGYDEAYLNEKIAKATKSWRGVDVDKFMDEMRGREPEVDLEEAAEEWCKENNKGIALCADKKSHYLAEGVDAFKAGAEWQKDQFEKNCLAHCDNLTKEEYDRETDFATEIIEKEHRQPTFTDAINYGMRIQKEEDEKLIALSKDSWYQQGVIDGQFKGLTDDEKYQQGRFDMKEQMMQEAVEGEVHPDDCEIWVNLVGYGYKFNDGDKVKLIVIKED